MNESQPVSPRRRMQELLAIPDSQRTDEQWDELHELEIQLSPINRDPSAADKEGRRKRQAPPANNNRPAAGGNSNGQQPRKPFKKFHKKTPKAPPASS